MPRDWKGPYQRRLAKLASQRGKAMAAERWKRDRQRRELLSKTDPIIYPGKIIRRVIVIDNEVVAREAIIYESDSIREARRKLNRVLYC